MQLCSQKLLSVACDSMHSGPEHHPLHQYGAKLWTGSGGGKINGGRVVLNNKKRRINNYVLVKYRELPVMVFCCCTLAVNARLHQCCLFHPTLGTIGSTEC